MLDKTETDQQLSNVNLTGSQNICKTIIWIRKLKELPRKLFWDAIVEYLAMTSFPADDDNEAHEDRELG